MIKSQGSDFRYWFLLLKMFKSFKRPWEQVICMKCEINNEDTTHLLYLQNQPWEFNIKILNFIIFKLNPLLVKGFCKKGKKAVT